MGKSHEVHFGREGLCVDVYCLGFLNLRMN